MEFSNCETVYLVIMILSPRKNDRKSNFMVKEHKVPAIVVNLVPLCFISLEKDVENQIMT